MSNTLDALILSENETLIRFYEASALQRPKATGYLVATNRRLMFIGESTGVIGQSVMHREVNIDHITGLYAYYDTGKNFGKLVFAAILTIFIIILSFAFPAFLVLLAWPAFILYQFFQYRNAQIQVNITADGTQNSPIAFGEVDAGGGLMNRLMSMFGASGNNAWMSVVAGPGRDAYTLVHELGALVLDIQTLGDHAVDKWSQKPLASKTTLETENPSASQSEVPVNFFNP